MKLIELSKMAKHMGVNFEECYTIYEKDVPKATVEAIPVEWLEKNAITQLDFGLGIRMLIKKWRDENEN